jgi:hypothetical protein
MPSQDEQLDKMSEDMAEQVGDVYEEAGNEMRNVILLYISAKLDIAKIDKAMNEIDVIIDNTQKITDEILDEILPEVYTYAVETADSALPASLRGVKLSPALKEEIALIVSDAKVDFGSGLAGARKAAGQALRLTLKEQLANKIAEGAGGGVSIPKITKNVSRLLGKQGFTTFVARNGSVWSLDAYSEMLTRTHVIKAANEAAISRARQLGVNVLEMSTHANVKDQPCLDVQGELFALDGKEYPKPPDMPIHPNCKHSLSLRPDLS